MPDADPLGDDRSIGDGEDLYYRVYPDAHSIVRKSGTNKYRPTSGAFRSDEYVSVDLASLSTPQQTQARAAPIVFHVATLKAKDARNAGCRVVPDPIPGSSTEPQNLAHARIIGNHKSGSGALSKSQRYKIAAAAEIVLLNNDALDGVEEE